MIRFDDDNSRFQFRVAGVLLSDDRVLLHRKASESIWALPGGRVELHETSTQAIAREMQEELQMDVDVVRLLWSMEAFYRYHEKQTHEIGFIYLLRAESPPQEEELVVQQENEEDLVFRWFSISSLQKISLYPVFLREELAALPQTPEHRLFQIHQAIDAKKSDNA